MCRWPAPIRESIEDRVGPDPVVHQLGGMSGGAVFRLEGRGRSAVLKWALNPVETHVYTAMSDSLRANGVELPHLYASIEEDGAFWLLLEDIPHPLPQDRWQADDEQLEMLHRLHTLSLSSVALPPAAYQPQWPEAMTERALSLFDPEVAASLDSVLQIIRDTALRLFQPNCLISGDPNPANWGLRDDETLVLFDWERCTLGTPAIDLAITVPGLGSRDAFERVAAAYNGSAPQSDPSQLASDIACAKVWSVVEFLAGYAQGTIAPTFPMQPLLNEFPEWVRNVGLR